MIPWVSFVSKELAGYVATSNKPFYSILITPLPDKVIKWLSVIAAVFWLIGVPIWIAAVVLLFSK